ncbi:MAG: Uma2 family endonuclease [Acidobacteria bacterium]|nr:Uma2 family endonuclease [Acidobacteriota bacterium]
MNSTHINTNAAAKFAADRNDPRNGKMIGGHGADRWHNLIISNTAIGLGSRMHGHKSEIYIGNMRVALPTGLFCFPDIAVVNGEPSFTDQASETLLNPSVIVDIFSNNSDSVEKSRKLENFLAMDSIKECLQIKQDEMRVEHYARQNQKQWVYRIYNERDDVISLDSIGCKISLQEVYAGVKLRPVPLHSRAVN